jgi:hypothetical protein
VNDQFADPATELSALLPGDRIVFADGSDRALSGVYACAETIAATTTVWRWLFLDDGSLLESAPRGLFRYPRQVEYTPGTSLFEELLAQDGALVRFEARVRAGTLEQRPIHLTLEGQRFRLQATGNVTARLFGTAPELPAWQRLAADPAQNVYFLLRAVEGDAVVLGLWTDSLGLSYGAPIGADDLAVLVRRPL